MKDADVVGLLADVLALGGFRVFRGDSDTRPHLLGLHQQKGLLAIEVARDGAAGRIELNRRISNLRQDIPAVADVSIGRRVIQETGVPTADGVLSVEEAVGADWLDLLPSKPLDADVARELVSRLAPLITFDTVSRGPLSDQGAGARAAARVTLDEEQAAVAVRAVDEVLLVTGPPGSGKTLVLAARARWLADQHPDWQIQILCFNRLLAPHLRRLVADQPNVQVATFGRFVSNHGFRISMEGEEEARRDVARELRHARHVVDAILVDEWQDFLGAWTTFLFALVRPGRGGIALAGDPKQALYRDASMLEALAGHHVDEVELTVPYRSTRQILEVTSALDDALEVERRDLAPDGPPVDLVYANNLRDQTTAIATDIAAVLREGSRSPGDIAVLYTRRFQLGSVCNALKAEGIEPQVALPRDADQLDLTENKVKVMTVHSAKGLEFEAVFLCGLEYLPGLEAAGGPQQARTGYVGATRAKDQLVITYSKDNAYLQRVRGVSRDLLRQWVWPDDYQGTARGNA
ncbi:3'-5' exonuclease [Actinotalea sp. K2]|uniref:3'-5' exonuclease n=1 Tax=Actinotalea sp. K2 TaxID=2939438 RepID=UPI0020175B2F|nr:3'-5' exonuclease [Actinotalea sp. K2]MCL3862942.1 AAA family ATPase [Actinotalea sp. K2]